MASAPSALRRLIFLFEAEDVVAHGVFAATATTIESAERTREVGLESGVDVDALSVEGAATERDWCLEF